MKKILFISPLPPPYYGSAISSKECLEILKKDKNFLVKNIKINYSKEMRDVGKVNFEKIKGFFKVKKEIKEKSKNFKPDLIYFVPATNGLGLIRDFLFIKQIKKFKIPIIFHVRSRIIQTRINDFFYKKMFYKEKAIILGDSLKYDILKYITLKDLFVLPNAIKNEIKENEIKKILKKRKSQKNFNILFLSNMDRSKGWPKLIEACKILKDKDLSFKCFFAGSWQNKKDESLFFDYIKKNYLQNMVFYAGQIKPEEKKKILYNSHVLVFPTEYNLETFGRVIIEAMMFGIPVIASSIATIPSIINDKKTGFILKENNPKEIAEKIEILIKNKDLAEKMGLEGRKRFIEEYEIKKYEKKFKEIINKSF